MAFASAESVTKHLAKNLGLIYQKSDHIAFGIYMNYTLIIHAYSQAFHNNTLELLFCVKGEHPYLTMLSYLPKGYQMRTIGCKLYLTVQIKGSKREWTEEINDFLFHFTNVMRANDLENCDQFGDVGKTSVYHENGGYIILTEKSARTHELKIQIDAQKEAQKRENFPLGLCGALLGGLIGAALVYFVARLGLIMVIISALMGVGIVYGYRWKGGKVSIPSGILCILISLGYSYLAFRADTARTVSKALGLSFSSAWTYSKDILSIAGISDKYYYNLLMIVGICVGCTVVLVIQELHEQKTAGKLDKLN